ncbi:methyltransferase [Aliiroseovarius crassostreae]|uniref:methyltransferase n=1 Tax=Aliiroseovarius crassostreae TaxID=154981 RepID=UPI003C7E4551
MEKSREKTMKVLDLPPVWLLGMMALAFAIARLFPGITVDLPWMKAVGVGLAGLGLIIMAAAMWEFLRAKTTIIPRQIPSAFLQRGIYRLSRNPIYLGDALVLFSAILWWGAPLALPLVPLFILLITHRFIKGEERGLRARFGAEFEVWAGKTRRWL